MMMKKIKKIICSVLMFWGCFFFTPIQAEEPIAIYTVEDLLEVSLNSTGSYILMGDLDLSDVEWKPWNLEGTFNGNGHSILNVNITSTTEETELTYDGNMLSYDTVFSGFFGIVKNATIQNLNLVNETIDVSGTSSMYVGGITGFMENSTIQNCSVSARLKMTVDCPNFGIAGAVGFGYGNINGVNADVELICIDTNVDQKDEQFLGGIFGNGYANIDNCTVNLRGYDSDHGYVHDGGLAAMWQVYPAGNTYTGSITNNTINGSITFFEDNIDRRAYCEQLVGEVMDWTFTNENNGGEFTPDERFDYSVNLLPEMCENPSYTDTIVAPTHDAFGYTEHVCSTCGYAFKDSYTVKEHTVADWTILEAPTTMASGVKYGTCTDCGTEVYEAIPVLTVNSISISSEAFRIQKGESTQLIVQADTGEELYGSWTSSDESIAIVNKEGKVTGISDGNAEITFTLAGSDLTASSTVSVGTNLGMIVLVLALVLFILFCLLLFVKGRSKKKKRKKHR